MLEAERIEDWRGQEVQDSDGESLGKLDEVFFDPQSRAPVLIAVKSGLLGRRSSLVPVTDATVAPDHIRVAFSKEAIGQADVGEVPSSDEDFQRLGDAYGVRFRDELRLESASEIEARRAKAEAAQRRAEELEQAARTKADDGEVATQRAQTASRDADRAHEEAEEARRAAAEARAEADRLG
jgi:sporulation protein YlmC with PRC-barrel domain